MSILLEILYGLACCILYIDEICSTDKKNGHWYFNTKLKNNILIASGCSSHGGIGSINEIFISIFITICLMISLTRPHSVQ